MQIFKIFADFLNSEAQDMDIVLVLRTTHRIYLGMYETTGQVPLITGTIIMS